MGLYTWPIGPVDVGLQLVVDGVDPGDETAREQAAAAAMDWVVRNVDGVVDDATRPTEDVVLGTAMLAARWAARRGSVLGVASFGEFGPSYVMRSDPDIAQLLGLGRPGIA